MVRRMLDSSAHVATKETLAQGYISKLIHFICFQKANAAALLKLG